MKCQGWRLGSRFFLFSILLLISACGKGHTGWDAFPVPVFVDSALMDSPEARADFEDGMKFWEERIGQKLFDVRGVWSGGSLPYRGKPENPDSIAENVVFIHQSWPFMPGYVGMTVVKPFDHGQMAMVMINPTTSFCNGDCNFEYTRTSLRKTFAHELGHFIGLSHTDDRNNIMYPTSLPGGTLDHLSVDETALRAVTQNSGG